MDEIERLMQKGDSLLKALKKKGEQIEKALQNLTEALFELTVVKRENWDEAIGLWKRGLNIRRELEVETVRRFHECCGWNYKNPNLEEVKKMLEEEGEGLLSQQYIDDVWTCRLTPLMTASNGGHDAVVGFLLDAGAEVGAKSETNETTAIHWASGKGNASTVKILIEAGAEVEAKTDGGWTPLQWAVYGCRWMP
jgi:hypothetical protein